ncbi:EAL domain-containing protein [Shewanella psychropiezotolerans]|uniref:EAL domain-containing protein n=2 Tax=Shewanella psychropiezotolerans TaxID=2593655 RepID=A0ABX5X5Y6_9GAMM|nr:EAL domain-containing protein [Shewanella psychropiezotolerans]QDO86754.1 EAL domain-containing protein [Shewanella psychropiezotolerans]
MMPNAIMKTITILLLALCLFGQAQAIDQPSESSNEIPLELKQASILLNADTYSVPEGLSQSTVTSLVEDKDGYVWIGTLNGLNRFDGKDFKHYFADDSYSGLPSSFIRSLLIDNKGNLLVGTDKGLVMLDRTIDKFVPISKELISKKLPIWSLMIIGNNIVVGTNKKIININKDNFSINSIIESDLFDGIKTIIKNNNAYLVRNYNGDIIDEIENKIIVKNSKNILKYNKTIIVNGEFGLSTVQGNKIIQVNPMQFDTIFILKKTLHGMIGNKLYSIDYNFTPSLSGIITNLDYTLDKPLVFPETNSLFVSTQNMGFIQIREKLNIIKKSSENTNNIWSINKEKNIKLTIATDSNIVSVYDSSNNIKKYDSSITGAKTAITYRRKLYVGSTSGLFSIDLLSNEREILTNHPVSALKFNEFNNTILAGTTDGLLLVVQPLTNTIINRLPVDIGNPIFDISSYNDSVFVSSQGGLFEINKDNSKPVYTDDIVFSVKNTSNKVFFGTTKSLMVYNKENNHHEVIYSNNLAVFSISSENDKLIATSMGEVIYINKESLYILDDTIGSQDEYNTQSSLYWKNKFIFGGINGVSILIPKDIDSYISETSTPKVKIEDLLVFNIVKTPGDGILSKPISISEQVSLKYSDYPFTFKFWSPSNHLGEIDFLYQMEGLSDSWIESKGVNSATYTNLSPGEYTFNIYAVDRFLSKKGDIKRLKVIITPPWWLSKQAKFVYFMLSLITSAIIVKAILRRREVQNQIAKSEERLKLSLWGSGDEMWDWDIETGQIYRSNIWGSLEFPRDGQRSGETGEESNIHPMDQERVSTALNDHFYGKSDHFEAAYRVKGKSDDWVWILDRAKIVERDEKDNPLRMTGTIKNINNFKHAEEQLRLFERAIANISEGMFILDSEFRFVEVNEACCELCLKPRDKFIGEQFNFDLYPDSYSEQIRTILHQQGRWSNDVDSAKGDGSSFLMELTVDAIYDELGQLSHYVGVFSDISRRKQQEEELRKLTNNDLLTNLPNRSSLMVTLGNLVKRDSHHTLMVLDLDNFKKINDSLGHQVGDELLIKVARRIETAVPYHTSIYRLGGDEFAILVDDNPDIGSSAVIANSVIEAFVTPFELTSDKVVVGMSIGIVLYPEDDQNEQALLRKADIAMYHAKSAGGNRYQFYSESLNRNAIRQLEVENLIRQGIKEDLFEVYYQPKIDLKSGKMAGMEALVRLNHPEQGLIPPSEFIPLAEENGLIVEIGDIVMKKACFAAQKWRSQGIFNGRVAVNLSSYQFALPDLQQRIESILRLTQLPAANLELEITEGTVIKEPEKAIKVMQQLSKMGVTLALDDFGTGYSSLSYLKRFPIHTLKIDKAFVDDIDKSDRDLKMVDSIITIAHNMGLSVVGEGVEDASQLSILKALNCEEIQGFIFSKPVSEAEFTKLLHKEFIEPDLVQNGKKAI